MDSDMAFPIPSHLPRRAAPQDVSSKILSKIDSATTKTLNSELARSWLAELDQSIQATKERIEQRIQADWPQFERQLASSQSVQERYKTLTSNVDSLNESVTNSETGIIPTFLHQLTKHAALAQEALDSSVKLDALSLLLECRDGIWALESLVDAGELPEAVEEGKRVQKLVDSAPRHLNETKVMSDIKRRLRAAKARAEEQLSDAYSRSIVISSNNLIIYPSIQVRQSDTVLSLSAVLSSLTPDSLNSHLSTLRRDLTTHFVDYLLIQPASVATDLSGITEHRISHTPAPPNDTPHATKLDNLSIALHFLSTYFFPSLPPAQRSSFSRSLCKPITTGLLNHVLIPLLPPSYGLLPPFLDLVKRAVAFEQEIVIGLLGNDANDLPVKAWADGVSGHYERQRRCQILDSARVVIVAAESLTATFRAEIEVNIGAPKEPSVVPVQAKDEEKKDAWGLDDADSGTGSSFDAVEDSWGFDDDAAAEENADTEAEVMEPPAGADEEGQEEPDSSEAWGWNDQEEDLPTEETAWDDPWGDEPLMPSSSEPQPPPSPPVPKVAYPKVATRLEKALSKGKKQQDGTTSSPSESRPSAIPPQLQPSQPTAKLGSSVRKKPSKLAPNVVKESYAVTGRIKQVIRIVEDVLSEGIQFSSSKLFPASDSSLGTVIFQTAPSVLDMYRALYPVKFADDLKLPERGMQFSNDCRYMHIEVERLGKSVPSAHLGTVKDKFSECGRHFKVLSDSWFQDVVEQQKQMVDRIIVDGARGFTDTSDQDRYDECEEAINGCLQEIRRLAQKLKGILPKGKYYTAIGMVIEAALSRILEDVLALPDIPEVESHRLSELCRIFNALEGLFVEDPKQLPFIVGYVPSWLKFSYLSDLLEASMADISELFDQGALVDFNVEELVQLVRALFADTPLRTNMINRLLKGHPEAMR